MGPALRLCPYNARDRASCAFFIIWKAENYKLCLIIRTAISQAEYYKYGAWLQAQILWYYLWTKYNYKTATSLPGLFRIRLQEIRSAAIIASVSAELVPDAVGSLPAAVERSDHHKSMQRPQFARCEDETWTIMFIQLLVTRTHPECEFSWWNSKSALLHFLSYCDDI